MKIQHCLPRHFISCFLFLGNILFFFARSLMGINFHCFCFRHCFFFFSRQIPHQFSNGNSDWTILFGLFNKGVVGECIWLFTINFSISMYISMNKMCNSVCSDYDRYFRYLFFQIRQQQITGKSICCVGNKNQVTNLCAGKTAREFSGCFLLVCTMTRQVMTDIILQCKSLGDGDFIKHKNEGTHCSPAEKGQKRARGRSRVCRNSTAAMIFEAPILLNGKINLGLTAYSLL